MDENELGKREQFELERMKIELEREKERLSFRKFVLGSVFTAITIAAVPPLFQLATAVVTSKENQQLAEKNRAAEIARDDQKVYLDYVKTFMSNALVEDIELRIRFAEYLSFISIETYPAPWSSYRKTLIDQRDEKRGMIDRFEKELSEPDLTSARRAEIERNLAWAYAQIGYVRPPLN
jgi:hypothetical protein